MSFGFVTGLDLSISPGRGSLLLASSCLNYPKSSWHWELALLGHSKGPTSNPWGLRFQVLLLAWSDAVSESMSRDRREENVQLPLLTSPSGHWTRLEEARAECIYYCSTCSNFSKLSWNLWWKMVLDIEQTTEIFAAANKVTFLNIQQLWLQQINPWFQFSAGISSCLPHFWNTSFLLSLQKLCWTTIEAPELKRKVSIY